MSTKVIKSVTDFSRFRRDVDLICYCGHSNTLPYQMVVSRFVANNWPKGLASAARHFRCSVCGSSPRMIGPMER